MKFQLKPLLFLLFTILLVGCSAKTEGGEQSQAALIKTVNPSPISVVENSREDNKVREIKDTVLSMDKIYDVAVIKGERDILVAYKVKHLYRFKMKKIEKDLKEKLEKQFNDESFTVSSDYKIFLEAVRLQERAKKENLSSKKIEKRLQEIIKLSDEKT